jgi:hypothetical protein
MWICHTPNLYFSFLHHVSLKCSHVKKTWIDNILKNQLTTWPILKWKNLIIRKIMCNKYARVYIHFKHKMWNIMGSKHDLRV